MYTSSEQLTPGCGVPPDELVVGPGRPSLFWIGAARADRLGQSFRLDADEISIGRADASTLVIDDLGASRRHARLARTPGGEWILTDVGSVNGTYVNGLRIRSTPLREGDKIQLGTVTALRFSFREPLEEREHRLRLSNRMDALGGRAAGLAHEINNPLAFVLGNILFLEEALARTGADPVPPPELVGALADARIGAERIRATVRDLLDAARAREVEEVSDGHVSAALELPGAQQGHRARTVRLEPVPAVAAPSRLGQVTPRPGSPGVRRRLLVVDDEPLVASALQRLLGRRYEVVTAAAATEALLLLRAGACFDAILSDLLMPEMTGMELFEKLGAELPEQAARMVFMTGGASTDLAAAFVARQQARILPKPIDLAELDRVLARLAPVEGGARGNAAEERAGGR